jgi:RNA polymerase sigma factor (sigma-70 family)
MTDRQLLDEYAIQKSEAAFAELVRRHADWVYSAARRLVRDQHLAEDVTQAVFLLLAQRARQIRPGVSLNGWLFNVTRNSARHALRSQARRHKHEKQAAEMNSAEMNAQDRSADTFWTEIAPRLEDLVAGLRPSDRDAVLLRFYEKKSMADVGAALGVSEDAAKKRVAAAVERLRRAVGPAGENFSVAALTAALAANAAQPCPVALLSACAKICAVAPAAHAAGITQGVIKMMMITKIKIAAVAALAITACVAGGVAYVALGQPDNTSQPPPLAAVKPVASPSNDTAAAVETARKEQCANNLKQLGMAVMMYSNGNAGKPPASLGDLTPSILDNPNVFICPGSGTLPAGNWTTITPDQKKRWVIDHTDYTFILGSVPKLADVKRPGEMVMAFEADNDHPDGMNILFADAHVAWNSFADAQRLIDATKLALNLYPTAPIAFFDSSKRVKCMSNMRQICIGLMMYAEKNRSALPTDLGTLIKSGNIADPQLFLCPDSARQVPADWDTMNKLERAHWITEHSDYTYVPQKHTTIKMSQIRRPADFAVLYESEDNHGNVINIAFADGHVEGTNPQYEQEILKKTSEQLNAIH